MIIGEIERTTHSDGCTVFIFNFKSEKYKPGTIREVRMHLMKTLPKNGDVALEVHFDGAVSKYDHDLIEKLSAEGATPPTVLVGIGAASYPASLPGGTDRSVRCSEYDTMDDSLPNLVIEEVLPLVTTLLPEGITISKSPDMHAICGCSSGGIAAWKCCWYRNDFFRRTYINSPSLASMAGGDAVRTFIRKYETKRIRVYMTVGTDDVRSGSGDWYQVALDAKAALDFAGYENEFEVFQGGKHCAGRGDVMVQERALRFIWQDWKSQPVDFKNYPPRVADIFDRNTDWREVKEIPSKPACKTVTREYVVKDGKVVSKAPDGKEAVVLELPWKIAAIAMSCDKWRIYVAIPEKRYIYAYAIQADGALIDGYKLGLLHSQDDFVNPGAFDLCMDATDRLLAATELGIQALSSSGPNSAIIPAPDHSPVVNIALAQGQLFIRTASGKTYARPTKLPALPDTTDILPAVPTPL